MAEDKSKEELTLVTSDFQKFPPTNHNTIHHNNNSDFINAINIDMKDQNIILTCISKKNIYKQIIGQITDDNFKNEIIHLKGILDEVVHVNLKRSNGNVGLDDINTVYNLLNESSSKLILFVSDTTTDTPL